MYIPGPGGGGRGAGGAAGVGGEGGPPTVIKSDSFPFPSRRIVLSTLIMNITLYACTRCDMVADTAPATASIVD